MLEQQTYAYRSDELQTGSSSALFGFIADCIGSFLEKHNEPKKRSEPLHMGFTFSFPVQQTGIASGKLLHWTKGFDCKDAVGRDVVQLLQEQLHEREISVQVSALINDTVGALLASAYESHGKTILGGIYGTGTNGAYIEKIANIPRFHTAEIKGHKTMIVNTEWGGYDSEREALPVTRFDNAVNRLDIRPRTHVFEKMISGMYLGEIARHVLLELVDELVLFEGYSSPQLNKQYGFDTALMSAIEEHHVPPTSPDSPTRRVLLEELRLDPRHVSDEDLETVERVCAIVGRRAARLSAVAISATIVQTERTKGNDTVQIGVDGSVIQYYPGTSPGRAAALTPGFDKSVLTAIADVLGNETADRVRIDHARDGSGVGGMSCLWDRSLTGSGTWRAAGVQAGRRCISVYRNNPSTNRGGGQCSGGAQ